MNVPTWRIGTRLLLAQTLVLVAAIATAGLIAALAGPPLFHAHMNHADHAPDPSQRVHVEDAYRTASAISLGLAAVTALSIAFVVSWYLTRRFQTALTNFITAAEEMSSGRYEARVAVDSAGPELDSLALAFNSMAGRLSQTEKTRRRLLSDLAHELRTPVATLAAYLEGLDDGVARWNHETRCLFGDQVRRLGRLADDIDAVSHAEEGRLDILRTPVAVGPMVAAAVRSHHVACRAKGVDLYLDGGPALTIDADESRLAQVLSNLLHNAVRHTHAGGKVSVRWQSSDAAVAISVTDTGDGISAEQLPHIFERFYRGDLAHGHEQGSGIGLTISKAIAEAHGGRLQASSHDPGTGATFTLVVPAHPQEGVTSTSTSMTTKGDPRE
ncbi:cell wall metabolism sensor histidine kinase WalK [uncultured Gordonia sp.]|uniref:sensor histidine kinase n=1 Tax=Gordonia sp. (in: high G+C Gram-positive bacteria) TaxID=84139 RepID=UPI000F996CAA|nr:HAMP domain-containing sensor histidine kinase [uncultured Gordonia sp.]RUP38928.1 MAG: HAMP domain-containing histidine kinase [Gordonia sp. (in: high G+C Gram-positive bacteria)]HNP57770.1 HAMP domain-containing sensor histidine kinase [Gordonia sp. (in: high G+C Gram-positive bacteria)]